MATVESDSCNDLIMDKADSVDTGVIANTNSDATVRFGSHKSSPDVSSQMYSNGEQLPTTNKRCTVYKHNVSSNSSKNEWKNWPHLSPSVEMIIESGFHTFSSYDTVECPLCSLKLHNWLATDDPYFEHVRHSQGNCLFLTQSRSPFVIAAMDRYKRMVKNGRKCKQCGKETINGCNYPCGHATFCKKCCKTHMCAQCKALVTCFIPLC